MDGLYAFTERLQVWTCRFPFGTVQCSRTLERLRHSDPPWDSNAPSIPLPTIAPEDRPLAYHFLARATFAIRGNAFADARPYLMAFSTLAQVRFAVVEIDVFPDGAMEILLTPRPETDFAQVDNMFRELKRLATRFAN